ncbi:hypothetical protein SMX18_003195 [Salmonella enterica subsp. enterica serovar Dublin]|nr:hypothetical protein [Salmonella enterica subsp. enterica serovar Dublin]
MVVTVITFPAYVGAKICRAKNDVRYYLNAFYIDPEGLIVSTDGRRLFCDNVKTNVEKGALINIKGKEPSKFNYAEVDHTNGCVSFYDDSCALMCTLPVDVVDGNFPDWRGLVRVTPGEVASIGFNLRYLADAYKISNAYKNEIARFDFQDQTRVCKISFSNTAFMVLAPARFK